MHTFDYTWQQSKEENKMPDHTLMLICDNFGSRRIFEGYQGVNSTEFVRHIEFILLTSLKCTEIFADKRFPLLYAAALRREDILIYLNIITVLDNRTHQAAF